MSSGLDCELKCFPIRDVGDITGAYVAGATLYLFRGERTQTIFASEADLPRPGVERVDFVVIVDRREEHSNA